jgi:DNA-damage-inducible protein J
MSQTMVSIRMDEDLKASMESVCRDLGMNLSTAFTIYARKVCREKRIPFEVSIDPFYSDENQRRLAAITARIDAGQARLSEHELSDEGDRT